MGKVKDLTGQRFGRLTVIEFAGVAKNKTARWKCLCDCGHVCVVNGVQLRRGQTKSCGCIRREKVGGKPKHGLSSSKVYCAWVSIKNRCLTSTNPDYTSYGGRGITICDEWCDDFQAFFDYVSNLEHFDEDGYTLDRINNSRGYGIGNVRWATMKEQSRNRRSNVVVEYNGEKLCLKEAAERSGIKYMTLFQRYHRGWRGEQLFKSVEP